MNFFLYGFQEQIQKDEIEFKSYFLSAHDGKYVSVLIRDSGAVLPVADIENLLKQLRTTQGEKKSVSVIDPGILPSLLIINKYQAKINILSEEYYSTISLKFPYQSVKVSPE